MDSRVVTGPPAPLELSDDGWAAPRGSDASAPPPLKVLMVTGAYYPEVSGGGLQCRELIRSLSSRIRFSVVSTSTDRQLPGQSVVDGVQVDRIWVDVRRIGSMLMAVVRLATLLLARVCAADVIHLHGFSRKALLIVCVTKGFRKKLLLTLHTAGHDEPQTVRMKGRLYKWAYAQADLVSGVSQRLQQRYVADGLPAEKFRLIPNGVDLARFRPADDAQRHAARARLGLPLELPLALFVGFFSRDKQPQVLFDAWARTQRSGAPASELVFIGATRSAYGEVDPELAAGIRADAQRAGLADRVVWIERTLEIEEYYRAADLFVLPSLREGLPTALLQAMATGLACIATRLPGVTDTLIEDGVNGRLVPPGDAHTLGQILEELLRDPAHARELGRAARALIERRYSMARAASDMYQAYVELMRASPGRPAAGRSTPDA